MKELKNRLAEIRKEKNLTQLQLGEMVGMTKRQIRNIEKGDSGVSILAALLIAEALEKEVEEVFYFEYDPSDAGTP